MAQQLVFRRPPLYDKQFRAIWSRQRIAVIEASTKTGKTVGCAVWLTEKAVRGHRGCNYWWVAPTRGTSKIAYTRIRRMFPRRTLRENLSELTLELPNGTTLWFKSGDNPDSLYGEDVHAIVIDEATRCKTEVWPACRSVVTATNGPIRIIGNVKGTRNWAYQLARKAEAGEVGMHYAKLTVHDAVEAGIIPASEVEEARRVLPEAVFNELYLAIPNVDGSNPFGQRALAAQRLEALAPGPVVAWGWDLASRVDWTVGIGLNAEGKVCAFERFQGDWEFTYREIARTIGTTLAVIDATGVGRPIVDKLQADGEYRQVEGFVFTSASKQRLMESLALGLQQGTIFYLDGPTTAELEAFEYSYTRTGVRYNAPDGMHDDCVCALALAAMAFTQRPMTPLAFPVAGPVYSPYEA